MGLSLPTFVLRESTDVGVRATSSHGRGRIAKLNSRTWASMLRELSFFVSARFLALVVSRNRTRIRGLTPPGSPRLFRGSLFRVYPFPDLRN